MESMKEDVEEVLETLRPMLMQDGGNVDWSISMMALLNYAWLAPVVPVPVPP
ncbi:MAG: hypothetical protein CM1200mP16_11630 [Nitrospina sp.]|nr:MAG: hypothetical protein CM1200mP16_11630 [Nitrospina sp.]